MNQQGFFQRLLKNREEENNPDTSEACHCVETVVNKLKSSTTSEKKPGILLGKIQSGKTRAFIGIIALAFDEGYDFVIILTKGTRPLSEQTVKRLNSDFKDFVSDKQMQIHDIMSFPHNLTKYELNQKLIVVAKKEINNLKRIIKSLTETYPDLKSKKLLIIDDEADFASLSFTKNKETGAIEQGSIARSIDDLRNKVAQSDFLQVTATPYSLYLQPDNYEGSEPVYLPKRPAFTEILPEHESYVGGDYYFIESENEESSASCVYEKLPEGEVELLKANKRLGRADRRSFRIEEIFTSPSLAVLRKALMTFIVGGCIRRLQQAQQGVRQEDYAFLMHTERGRTSHSWQEEIVTRLSEELTKLLEEEGTTLDQLISESYADIERSIRLTKSQYPKFAELPVPSLVDTKTAVRDALRQEMILAQKVNSDEDVKALLDESGQLRLRTPLNIFIGGQILDRGITIKNLIGFYYGRNPKKFQQDTVLQHARMYGARSKPDLAVTRFYTTAGIYDTMKKINEFDNALREAFLNGSHDKGVYFIRKDDRDRVVPCSPNKIMLSNITTLKPFKRLLPIGFNTDYKTKVKGALHELDQELIDGSDATLPRTEEPTLIDVDDAIKILRKIHGMFVFEEPYSWDIKSHIAGLEFLSRNSADESVRGKVWLLVRSNRNNKRIREDSFRMRFFDAPDTSHIEGKLARTVALDCPMLMLFRQSGAKEQGWMDSPFWWPVIYAQKNTPITIYSSDVRD
jgi:hypothetical protein